MNDPLHTITAKLSLDVDGASLLDDSQGMKRPVVGPGTANPTAELPVLNAKYILACKELHMADKGINRLLHFDRFINLEVLWLNDNEVTPTAVFTPARFWLALPISRGTGGAAWPPHAYRLHPLRAPSVSPAHACPVALLAQLVKVDNMGQQVRMRALYLNDNRIASLDGSLQHMKFMTVRCSLPPSHRTYAAPQNGKRRVLLLGSARRGGGDSSPQRTATPTQADTRGAAGRRCCCTTTTSRTSMRRLAT